MEDLNLKLPETKEKSKSITDNIQKALTEKQAFEHFADIMSDKNLKHRTNLASSIKEVYIEFFNVADEQTLHSKICRKIIIWKEECYERIKQSKEKEEKEAERAEQLQVQSNELMVMRKQMQLNQNGSSSPGNQTSLTSQALQAVAKGAGSEGLSLLKGAIF